MALEDVCRHGDLEVESLASMLRVHALLVHTDFDSCMQVDATV